jgi:hypothetical protein
LDKPFWRVNDIQRNLCDLRLWFESGISERASLLEEVWILGKCMTQEQIVVDLFRKSGGFLMRQRELHDAAETVHEGI